MATVPRGIQPVKHVNKDGSTTLKYRVRIVRKNITEDKRFDDLQEAKEFLANSKNVKGVEKIKYWSKTEEELKRAKIENDTNDYSFGYFIDLYVYRNVTKGLTEEEINALPELDRRNVKNKLSFYKTIKNTSIIDKTITHQEKEQLGIMDNSPIPRFMSGFDIRKIGVIQIDDYIIERLKTGVAKISVAREITHISNVFRKLRHLTENVVIANLPNIALQHDKDLLIQRNKVKRKINLTQEEQKKLLEELGKKNNKDMLKIATLSILTSMRRSEIVTLTKSQVFDTHIELYRGKNGNARDLHIDKEAQEYLHSLEVIPGTDRYFSYSISGFGKMFYDFLQAQKATRSLSLP